VTTAPYGTWSSPITAAMVAGSAVSLSEPWIEDGVVYWLERRPEEGGRGVVVRGGPFDDARDVTPAGFNVRTKVHEYGGGAYFVHRGVLFFSNFEDQRLYRQEAGADPVAITADTDGRHRYADGRMLGDGRTIVCVRERHEGSGRPDEVLNELVVLGSDGSTEPTVVASGRDFYAAPRPSPDGSTLCWLEWDLPWMPWDGTELWIAAIGADGSLSDRRRVAGAVPGEAIVSPAWSPAGELHFVSDRTGWWNLYRARADDVRPLSKMDAEFGWPMWVFGESPFAFLSDGRIACLWEQGGVQHVSVLDPESGELIDLDLPHSAIQGPYLVAAGSQIVFIGGAPTIPEQVVSLDFGTRAVEVLAASADVEIEPGYLTEPVAIEFPTDGGVTAHALFYPPRNRDFTAPDGELPPLIVASHGGPTGESVASFDLEIQYYTSRGFAVVDVNYGGSTGFGREYRERLYGQWGVVDTVDCINAAKHLAAEGLVDGSRLCVRGGSAGGYTTLCALTFHDDFAAGASYYGIADLVPFATGDTHKFESRYEHMLVGPWPEAEELYSARSPINFVDRLSCPVIVLQGAEDEVVPPTQAELMVNALRAKGLPYAYLLFEGEQHGFRKAENIARSIEAEVSFYAAVFGFALGDQVEPVEIHNLRH